VPLRGDDLLALAQRVAPLASLRGVNGFLLSKAQGCRVFDAENVAYLDFVGGGGANLLGYANQYVLDAIRRAATTTLAAGYSVVAEVELAALLEELLPHLCPWALTGSEVEAWELALRWCRRSTGRNRIVVFDGNRRGAVEAFQVAPLGPLGISQPLLAGIPPDVSRFARVVPWGDVGALRTVLDEVGVDVAAIVLDPLASQFGVVPPDRQYLADVEQAARQVGAFLVLDETLTGFRLGRGGAAELLGLAPDVSVFGSVLSGGVAQLGAVAWRRELEALPGDDISTPPSPIAIHAAAATLSVLRNDAVYKRLEERGAQLQSGVEALAEKFERPLRVARVGSIFSCAFARQAVVDGRSHARADHESWQRFHHLARENGLLLPARSSAPAFISHAHGVKDIEQALTAMEAALRRMQKEEEG
jgi:glutamate-1-semialdehyde 2,1-aminomutase